MGFNRKRLKMIDSTIVKLTKYEGDGEHSDGKCLDDIRIGMELLKKQYYPNVPDELKEYLYGNVVLSIIREYFEENLDDSRGLENWKITWRE